jgi:hypothetical protein
MEFFYSTPKETKSHLKDMINYTDYVCIVLKNEYGDTSQDLDISWTEYEFNISKQELNKPIVAFIYNGANQERDARTEALIKRIEHEGITLRFWSTIVELGSAVVGSVQALIREKPAPGWVRTDSYHDEQESLQAFYRRSADYDFSSFIMHGSDIRILMNDGYNWRLRHKQVLTERFTNLQNYSTTIITLDEGSALLDYVADKSEKSSSHQRNDIVEFHNEISKMAIDCGYNKLKLLKGHEINTHCLFICSDYAIVTTYFTSKHRFQHLPLFKYKKGTDKYDDFLMDFEMISRPALDKMRQFEI